MGKSISTNLKPININIKNYNFKANVNKVNAELEKKIADYEAKKQEAYEKFQETDFYKKSEEISKKVESDIANIKEGISNGTNATNSNNAFSIFDTIEDSSSEKNGESNKKDDLPTQTSEKSGVKMAIPDGERSFKSYTKYTKVTDKSTPQYAVVNGLTSPYGKFKGTTYNTKTDKETGVRYVTFEGDDTKYYCAAMGTYYGEVGDTFKVTTDEGNTYHVIMCDAKGNDAMGKKDGKTWYHTSGGNKCLTEFYIEYPADDIKVYDKGKYIGTTGTYDSVDRFSGNVTSIEKLS